MMTWAPSLPVVNKPLAYIVLSLGCCVLENVSNEAVKKRCGYRRRTFPAFIIAQLIDLTSMRTLLDVPASVTIASLPKLCVTEVNLNMSTSVASNRPTEALASVISFTFVVYSHYKHS